jgi:hypothetical protein
MGGGVGCKCSLHRAPCTRLLLSGSRQGQGGNGWVDRLGRRGRRGRRNQPGRETKRRPQERGRVRFLARQALGVGGRQIRLCEVGKPGEGCSLWPAATTGPGEVARCGTRKNPGPAVQSCPVLQCCPVCRNVARSLQQLAAVERVFSGCSADAGLSGSAVAAASMPAIAVMLAMPPIMPPMGHSIGTSDWAAHACHGNVMQSNRTRNGRMEWLALGAGAGQSNPLRGLCG